MPEPRGHHRAQRKASRPFWKRALVRGGAAFLGIAVVAGLIWAGRPRGEDTRPLDAGPTLAASGASTSVHIYYGSTCHDCPPYVEQQAMPALRTRSWSGPIEVHDFTKQAELQVLTRRLDEVGLASPPPDVGQALAPATFHVALLYMENSRVVLLGHPPGDLIRQVLALDNLPPRLVLSQEEMHGAATKYEVWNFQGRVASFPISTPVKNALTQVSASR